MSNTSDEKKPDINTILDKNLRALDDISNKMLNDFVYRNNLLETVLDVTPNATGGKSKKHPR